MTKNLNLIVQTKSAHSKKWRGTMGTFWNYFKNYEVGLDDDGVDNVLHYKNGGKYSLTLTYSSSANLRIILDHFDVNILIYNWTSPPESNKLKLIKPETVAQACEEAIALLKKEENPIISHKYTENDYLPLFEEDKIKIKALDELRETLITHLEELKDLSKKGYFITEEFN